MSRRLLVFGILAVSAVGGAGTMVVELAAVRLLAPWYGSSQVVWTNVIGVVLLALALGYSIGGRLSTRGNPLAKLGVTLLLAGLGAALLPVVSTPIVRLFLPEGLALHEAADAVLWGSLAAALCLFLPPAAVLGCVAPLAVEAVQEIQKGAAGRAGGAVLSASTLGSLLGVFGTSHLLIPHLGIRGTFWMASGALVFAGALALFLQRGSRGTRAALLVGVGWAATFCIGESSSSRGNEGWRELASGESTYQSIRVVEEIVPAGDGMRFLQVNEGFDSFQSVWQPQEGLLPLGYYYNDFALPVLMRPGTEPWRLLVLGLGGGTALRVLRGVLPDDRELHAIGIELDPLVVELARDHMQLTLAGPGSEVHANLDARVALRNTEGLFDQIILDCYANQVEIPPHLCTLEFFRELRDALGEYGFLSVNLGGFGFDDPVVASVARTCAAAFEGKVLLLRVPRSRNYSLLARRSNEWAWGMHGTDWSTVGLENEQFASHSLPDTWRYVDAQDGGRVLTDDRCPIELLQARSIKEGAERLGAGTGG